ncbi:hypothetical protein Plhal710r2_c033g0121011 [Plasmopara halstedii]
MFSLTVRGTYPLQPLFGLQGAAERFETEYIYVQEPNGQNLNSLLST